MVDNSGWEMTNTYPNGYELLVIGNYAQNVMGYPYPSVPASIDEFLDQGLNVGVRSMGLKRVFLALPFPLAPLVLLFHLRLIILIICRLLLMRYAAARR